MPQDDQIPPETVRAAQLRIAPIVLEKLLLLPEEWKVKHLRLSDQHYDDAIILVVEGPDLDPVCREQQLPMLHGVYTKHADGSVTVKFGAR